jgi:hypothetical protein
VGQPTTALRTSLAIKEQSKQKECRERAAAPETGVDPQPQDNVCKQVQGDSTEKAERWDGSKRTVGVGEGGSVSQPSSRNTSGEDGEMRPAHSSRRARASQETGARLKGEGTFGSRAERCHEDCSLLLVQKDPSSAPFRPQFAPR